MVASFKVVTWLKVWLSWNSRREPRRATLSLVLLWFKVTEIWDNSTTCSFFGCCPFGYAKHFHNISQSSLIGAVKVLHYAKVPLLVTNTSVGQQFVEQCDCKFCCRGSRNHPHMTSKGALTLLQGHWSPPQQGRVLIRFLPSRKLKRDVVQWRVWTALKISCFTARLYFSSKELIFR